MKNKFRPYNKSLLANLFMSREHKYAWNEDYIPTYDNINIKTKYGMTVLIYACAFDKIHVIRLLLQYPYIDVNIKGKHNINALFYACNSDNMRIKKMLLQHPSLNVNEQEKRTEQTVLVWACLNNKIDIVKLLLKRNDVDIRIQDSDGYTAMYYAKRNNSHELINLLEKYNEK